MDTGRVYCGISWFALVGYCMPLVASQGHYIFGNFIYETNIIMSEYVVPQWLFINIETGMTLNSHFVLNI